MCGESIIHHVWHGALPSACLDRRVEGRLIRLAWEMKKASLDDSKREAIPKGSHLIISAPTIDLEYGHANELCEQGRPQPPAVLVRLQMHNSMTYPGTCKA